MQKTLKIELSSTQAASVQSVAPNIKRVLVELDASMLKHVGGGMGPNGTWGPAGGAVVQGPNNSW